MKGKKVNIQSLIGVKYNLLTIIKGIAPRKKADGMNITMVYCECECGNGKNIILDNIINNHTKSCGCLRKTNRMKNTPKSGEIRMEINGVIVANKQYNNKARRSKIIAQWNDVYDIENKPAYIIISPETKED